MGGDGMGGLAAAIALAMAFMVAGAALLVWLFARAASRKLSLSGPKAGVIQALAVLFGLGLGVLAVIATFYEQTWSPPPRLQITAPETFAESYLVLLEDHASQTALAVTGGGLPFSQQVVHLPAPSNGLLRVKDLSAIAGRGDIEVVWSDGATSDGLGGGPAPAGSGATLLLYVSHVMPDQTTIPAFPIGDDSAVLADIKRRESSTP